MITSIQGHSLSMAGLLANVSTLRVTEGGTQNAWWYFWNRNSDSFNTCSKNFCESIKNGLMFYVIQVYGYYAPAKSGAGIGVLITCIVPTRTKRVFLSAKSLHIQIMVGWMGLPKGRPVSIQAGYANLVQLTTSLRLASLGGEFTIHCIEAATMATILTPHPSFIWIIAAIRRDRQSATVKIFHVTAVSEREARRTLVRYHVCFFAGRIRLTEVDHA
ncbi:ash family protein [Klebsiella sp. Acro-834]|uniref:host cell division inhibitor Icd-like protein n=1 Tax=unclassified Klebsiella TaxID=2608929 RepID=UPI00141A2DDF|nr:MULTISPECIES: host cell division inhibitor Icd-like protein [unclassified Klebsiella]NIG26571.1 ash family protein [Klebsiella sp. Acro-834]NIG40927.1 ash family protein [Klebsiella sp. Acro-833]